MNFVVYFLSLPMMKRKVRAGLFFLVGLSLFHSCKPNKQEEKSETPKAIAPVSEAERWSREIAANPKNAVAYYQRAKVFVGEKKFKLAASDINEAVSLDSTKAEYFFLQADVLFANLLVPQSVQAFQKCTELDPENIDAWLRLAELHLYIKKYKESIQYANEALKIDKHKAKAYFIKGFVFKESGDTSNAISSFQTCVEQEPENYDAYIQLGLLYGARHNKLATQYYSSALRLNPASTEALYNRGLFYQDHGDLDKAVADYKMILQIDPAFKDAHYNMGYINLVYLKNYRQAVAEFSDAIRLGKYYVEAYYNRGLSYEKLGDKAAAEADYKTALGIDPGYKLAIAGMKRLKK
jgi:tetratricopeptide (TPR) repeat protein